MQLYHVQADDPVGENLDWFVVAYDPKQAVALWVAYCNDNGFDPEEGVTRVRLVLDDIAGTRFEPIVTLSGVRSPAVVEWDNVPVVFEP